jgi:hypothetical protein
MNPTPLSRIQTFREQVLLPALRDLETLLESPEQQIVIASTAETRNHAVNAMLQQMHFGKPYLLSPSSRLPEFHPSSTVPQAWIGDSFYLETLRRSDTEASRVGQYCLSIEFRMLSSEQIEAWSIIGQTRAGDQTLQIQQHRFEDSLDALSLEQIQIADILFRFTETFRTFEESVVEPEAIVIETPEAQPPEAEPLAPDLALRDPSETPAQPIPQPPYSDVPPASQESPTQPTEIAPEPAPEPELVQPVEPILTPQQQLYALQQKAVELSKQLSPTHTPLTCRLNPDLSQPCRIIALRDRHERLIDLCLEYSPTISADELTNQLQRLSHYQSLELLAHQRQFLEARLQTWLQLYKQPSPGAIVPYLQEHLTQHSQTLYRRLKVLADNCLDSLTAPDLQTELKHFTTHQNHEKTILDQLESHEKTILHQPEGHPILGYLDACLIQQHTPRKDHPILGYLNLSLSGDDAPVTFLNPFTDVQSSLDPESTHYAQHLHRKDNSLQLTLIETCTSERYQTYQQRFPSAPALHTAIRYTLTQKLYPNRTVTLGPSAKDAYPRLELMWGETEATTPPDHPFTQIWRVYPMLRAHPPQWLVITATDETQKLKTIVLENGHRAQEGTKEYLVRSLEQMQAQPDEYTHDLGTLVAEAFEQGRMKWTHLHQTQDPQTGALRDIVQLQFQLRELG